MINRKNVLAEEHTAWIGTEKKLKTKSRNACATDIGFLTEKVQNGAFIIKAN